MMTTVSPLVSVVIPTYNRRTLVPLTIDSALQQTYPAVEVIVVDDGSTDGTETVLKESYGDRIKYIWQENQGESVARNRGVAEARGEYIALLDSDDLWMSEKLARQVPLLQGNPQLAVVACEAWLIDRDGNRLDLPPLGQGIRPEQYSIERLVFANTFANGSTALMRRDLLLEVGGFDPQIRYGEDWDLWLRMRIRGEFALIPEQLACVRRHTDTQCHLPRRESVARTLADHLRLLDKAFATPDGSLTEVRSKSLARQYAEAAFASYAWGEGDRGNQWLSQAIDLDPGSWNKADKFRDEITRYLIARTELEGGISVDTLRELVALSLTHSPVPLNLRPLIAKDILGAVLSEAGYRAFLKHDFLTARHFMQQALKCSPRLWRNLGMLKRLLRTIVG